MPAETEKTVPVAKKNHDIPMWRFAILVALIIMAGILKIKTEFFDPVPPPSPSLPVNTKERVERHIAIPAGQEPTIVTIERPEEYQRDNRELFKNVEAGDQLLIWPDQAILYSPSKDRIIAVWPLGIQTK